MFFDANAKLAHTPAHTLTWSTNLIPSESQPISRLSIGNSFAASRLPRNSAIDDSIGGSQGVTGF